jgi:hypothetical protein
MRQRIAASVDIFAKPRNFMPRDGVTTHPTPKRARERPMNVRRPLASDEGVSWSLAMVCAVVGVEEGHSGDKQADIIIILLPCVGLIKKV